MGTKPFELKVKTGEFEDETIFSAESLEEIVEFASEKSGNDDEGGLL